jgi:RimJ/RimL family protein N-acetyltransferase
MGAEVSMFLPIRGASGGHNLWSIVTQELAPTILNMISSSFNEAMLRPEILSPRQHARSHDPAEQLAVWPPASLPTTLQDHSVLLRPFQLADAEPMYEAARESMGQLCAWMTWCQPSYSISDAKRFVSQSAQAWEKGEHCSFAILDAKNSAFLGSIGLNHLNFTHKLGNIGYWVRSSATGRGWCTAATRLMASYALHQLGLTRLEFLIPLANVASQRVARKAGAHFEGILRSRLLISGTRHDAAMYALLRERE